jgi:hypothetical protein
MTLRQLVDAIARREGGTVEPDGTGWTLSIPQDHNRRQGVTLTEFADDGEPMVRFTTRIGKAGELAAPRFKAALEVNLRLPHGCLALDGDQLVLTATRSLRDSTAETAGDAVRFLARQADAYERLIFKSDVH